MNMYQSVKTTKVLLFISCVILYPMARLHALELLLPSMPTFTNKDKENKPWSSISQTIGN